MSLESPTQLDIRDFKGQMSGYDPHDMPPGGAISQINCVVDRDGELTIRGGMKLVTFES